MKREREDLNQKKAIDPSKIYLMLMVLNYDNIAIKFPKKKKKKKSIFTFLWKRDQIVQLKSKMSSCD